MRKSWVFIIALVIVGFLAGASWAGKVNLSGTHSPSEIKGTCSEVGGTPYDVGNNYGCTKDCGEGGVDFCSVNCKKGSQKCTVQCPKCGERERTLPTLGGADAPSRVLKDSGARPSKRY